MRRSSMISWMQLRVVGVVLTALLVIAYAVYRLGQSAKLFTAHYTLVAFVANASGLHEGGAVTVAGQLAGSIRSIQFLPVSMDTTRHLRIVVELDHALQPQVREDSHVLLRTQGLLGDKVFDITPGTPHFRPLHQGDTLTLGNSVDYEAMIQRASTALGDMVALTHALRQVTELLTRGEGTMGQLLTNRGLYDQFAGMLTRSNALLIRLQNPHGSLGRLLDDPALYDALTHMVASVDSVTAELQSGHGTAARLLRDDSLYTALVGVTTRTDSLVTTLSTMVRANGTASKLLTDSQLYDQLLQSVTHLNEILVDIRLHPQRYTKGAVRIF